MNGVDFTVLNGGLGATLQTADGIAGLVATGVSQGSVTAGTPVLLSGLASLTALGVTQSGNAFVWKQVSEFYAEAGDGALLYLNIVTAASSIDAICTVGGAAEALLTYAQGKVRLLGAVTNDTAVYTGGTTIDVTKGINADAYTAAGHMKIMVGNWFAKQKPFRAIIGGTSYTNVPGNLNDLTQGSNNAVAILVADSVSGNGAAVGLTLGRLAKIPVQRKISRVKDGPLAIDAAYVGTNTVEASATDIAVLTTKGFITIGDYPNESGYFFNGDQTNSPTTDDYHFLARGRVIDKAHVLAYSVFVQEVDDEIKVNDDGTLDAGFCKWLSTQMENQINNTMKVNNEISNVICTIDPSQNILATNNLAVELEIVPVGYASAISVMLLLNNPAA